MAAIFLICSSPARAEGFRFHGTARGLVVLDQGGDLATPAGPAPADRAFDAEFRPRVELWRRVDTGVLGGVALGAVAGARARTGGVDPDDGYVYAQGLFGTVSAGWQQGAADRWAAGPAAELAGFDFGDGTLLPSARGLTLVRPMVGFDRTGRAFKLAWAGPRVAGVRLAMSWAPGSCRPRQARDTGCDAAVARGGGDLARQAGIWEAGASYVNPIGPVDVALSFGYALSGVRDGRPPGGGRAGAEDRHAWRAGVRLGWQGITVGAGWIHDGLGVGPSAGLDLAGMPVDARVPVSAEGVETGVRIDLGDWFASLRHARTTARVVGPGTPVIAGRQQVAAWWAAMGHEVVDGVTVVGAIGSWSWDDRSGLPPAARHQAEGDATLFMAGAVARF